MDRYYYIHICGTKPEVQLRKPTDDFDDSEAPSQAFSAKGTSAGRNLVVGCLLIIILHV